MSHLTNWDEINDPRWNANWIIGAIFKGAVLGYFFYFYWLFNPDSISHLPTNNNKYSCWSSGYNVTYKEHWKKYT